MIILNALFYYLIIIPISLLPFRILYFFSDFLFLLVYKVFGYRTKVVRQNLMNALPHKSQDELKEIEKNFYHHLCDVIVETVKSFTISNSEIQKRMVLENPELINRFYDVGKSVLIAGGHYNNWEWAATGLEQQMKHQVMGIYTPLSNKFFNEKMLSSRGRFGLRLISFKLITKYYEDHQEECTATIFGIDQSPRNPAKCYWTKFLNQDTGVQYGIEKFAKELNYPVVFGSIRKVSRGYYTLTFEKVSDQPVEEPYGMIIEKATRRLENQIQENPEYWLWTHRRWKHKRPENDIEKGK